VLKCCIESELLPNFEKCLFMVEPGVVFGHVVSLKESEVDNDKVDIISIFVLSPMCQGSEVIFRSRWAL